jgi:hypothetical protein
LDKLPLLPLDEVPLFAAGRLLAFPAGRLAFGFRGAGRLVGVRALVFVRLFGPDVWGTCVTSIPYLIPLAVHNLPTIVLYGRTKDSVTMMCMMARP